MGDGSAIHHVCFRPMGIPTFSLSLQPVFRRCDCLGVRFPPCPVSSSRVDSPSSLASPWTRRCSVGLSLGR